MKSTFSDNLQTEKKRCNVCGEWLDADARFCEFCGAQLEEKKEEQPKEQPKERPVEQPKEQPKERTKERPEDKPKEKSRAYYYLAIGCGVLVILLFMKTVLFGKKQPERDYAAETQTFIERETETEEEYIISQWVTEKEVRKEEEPEADIDAVHNRNCRISGLFFYTDSMDAPVLVLDDLVSLYVNSTDGEQVYYGAVSQICFGTCAIGKKKLKKYNNVKVDVTGSLWAEDDVVYVDVQELSGELPETEKETETEYGKDRDYILPESDSKYLTEADIAGLTLKEINYAKNEIYARHGRKFDSAELRRYFKSKEWYDPRIDPDDFSVKVFNSYEKKNTEFLAAKEESMQRGGYKLDQ